VKDLIEGWNKMDRPDVTLIFPSSPFLLSQTMFPPLGILALAAFLKLHGIKVQCLDLSLPGHTKEMAEADIIGLSFSTPQREEAFKLAEYYKAQDKFVVAGGPHPSHMPDECYAHGIDKVIDGPGEIPLLHLMAELLDRPYLKEVTWKDYPIDSLPFPDRTSLPMDKYQQFIDGRPATAMIASRDCPYSCSFCANIRQKFEIQGAIRTMMEIEHLNLRYGYTAFSIYDDTFAIDKKRLKMLADMLEPLDFRFRCFCRANLLTEEVCNDFKRMGVTSIGIGVESGSDEILKLNLKGTSTKENTMAVENLRKVGIESKAFLIVGLPGETEETVAATARWIEEARPDDIAASVFQPLPGSAIFKNPEKWGVSFVYDSQPMWYRGKPGEYKPTIATKDLSTERIAELRDWLENKYKDPTLLK
jgi:anaerobic magnesium-protoporphyrin IX monomethyl ester cyclase